MRRFNIPLVAEGLTAYAIAAQNGYKRPQPKDAPSWAERRRFWTDAVLQGMARLDGKDPDPRLMEQFDRRLEQASVCADVEAVSPASQKALIQNLRSFVSALEATGDDRRRQVNVVRELLEDMIVCHPWADVSKSTDLACDEAERALQRMTAQMPIRFTRILLGGDAGPHWSNGFAPGAVTDAEAVKQTAVYQEAVQLFPEVTSWPALCTVYVGRNLPSALGTVDATDFDLEIMNRAGERFLNERGVRWTCGFYQMTIPAGQEATMPEETQEEDCCPLLQGDRALGPDDLSIFELYSSEDNCITFCLDVLAEENAVFGRQLSNEQDGSYIMPYAVYDEATGQVRDTLDIELRLPHDEKWFHCKLSPEVRVSLKEKMDAFCVELYGEHLPEPQTQHQDESAPYQAGPTM